MTKEEVKRSLSRQGDTFDIPPPIEEEEGVTAGNKNFGRQPSRKFSTKRFIPTLQIQDSLDLPPPPDSPPPELPLSGDEPGMTTEDINNEFGNLKPPKVEADNVSYDDIPKPDFGEIFQSLRDIEHR